MDMSIENEAQSEENVLRIAIPLLMIITLFAPMLVNLEIWGFRIEIAFASMT